MKRSFLIALPLLFLLSCRKQYEAPVPNTAWNDFDSPAALHLPNDAGQKIEGVYSLQSSSPYFGSNAVAKWSYTAEGKDTTYNLSFFCERDASYFICEGKQKDSVILLNGYWRRMVGTETGRVHLIIGKATGIKILSGDTLSPTDKIVITGSYGNDEAEPDQPIELDYARPLYHAKPLEIVVHRGGGRTSDLLPASENSVEIIKLASRFGATGIEIDMRLTKDGVPVIYHDATLNERLIQKNGMVGPIEDYTYDQLYTLVRLINGEHIPTMREVLNTVVYKTPLEFVWLDTKYYADMKIERDLQAEFMQKAAAIGRTLNIYIGIPDRDVLNNFKKLPGYQNIPSVNELTRKEVADVNSAIWGPRFTLGLQNTEVGEEQAQGRKAFVWTLDEPQDIQEFINNGRFDGILSNYPSAVAYFYYAKQ